MNNTIQFPDRERVENQAANWVAVIDRGLTDKEEQELNQWLSESVAHGDELVEFASMWDLLDVLSPIAKLLPIEQKLDQTNMGASETPVAVASSKNKRSFSIAAGFGALAIGLVFAAKLFPLSPTVTTAILVEPVIATATQVYMTAIGERSNIILADGSEIKLNTNSQVSVQFTEHKRHLNLIKGEAFFTVAKNPNRPFVVLANNSRVTAIGTAFSVDVSSMSDTEVLVTEGKVKVDYLHELQVNSATEMVSNVPVYLFKGQKVLLNKDEVQITHSNDLDTALAWREGMIVFTGQSLAEVIREIDRYIPLDFQIIDQEIASISVGGFFKTGDLDQLLLILEQNFGVTSKRVDNKILLSKMRN